MVVEFLTGEEEMRAFAERLRPEPTADGFESEERLVICSVSWERIPIRANLLDGRHVAPKLRKMKRFSTRRCPCQPKSL
jgi:hypothetical protein